MAKAYKKTKDNPLNKELTTILNAVDFNYYYSGIEVEYNRDSSNCDCPYDDYCRCSTIQDVEIKSIDLNAITAHFIEGIINPILAYSVSRLLTLHKLYDEDGWEPETQHGYYGEEFDGVYIRHQNELKTDITILWNMSDKERIEFVLTKEYGYIADTLQDVKNYTVIETSVNFLHMPPSNDMFKLDTKHIAELQKNISNVLPLGIYLLRGKEEYNVADGRHRLFAAKNEKLDKVKIVVGEK